MELSSTQNALETASTIALDIITVDVQGYLIFAHARHGSRNFQCDSCNYKVKRSIEDIVMQ